MVGAGRMRRRGTWAVALAAVAVLVGQPALADDGLATGGLSRYVLDPRSTTVDATVTIDLRNATPNRGGLFYFYNTFSVPVPAGAQHVQARSGGSTLAVSLKGTEDPSTRLARISMACPILRSQLHRRLGEEPVEELRFDGRVVVVTGGGRGIGRSHALLFATRGAQVVVADYGASLAGAGASSEPADDVVQEIAATGGNAVACFASVAEEAGAASIVEAALTNFGRIDAVINNAGISDKHPFEELTVEQYHRMMDVHMFGTLYVTRAVWPHFVKAGYGRVVNTTSEGMLGTLEQLTSYGAAKGAVLGLTRTLAAEGLKHGIRVNAVAPRARTRMAEEGKGAYEPGSAVARRYDEVMASLDPELVSPTAVYLAHESCRVNGEALVSGGGNVRRMAVVLTQGIEKPGLTVEDVAENLDTILDITDPEVPVIGGFGS